jgi:hypothetical protein
MSLIQLYQDKPLLSEIERLTKYVDVSEFKKLRLCGYADCLIDIHLEWSYNGSIKCITTSLKLLAQLWKSEEVAVLMPYLRLHIINNSNKINESLMISLYSFGNKINPSIIPTIQEPIENAPVIQKSLSDIEDKPKAKRVWFSKKSPKQECRDNRLPGFIPMNSILIGNNKVMITSLPQGNVGDILMMACDGPRWIERNYEGKQDQSTQINLQDEFTLTASTEFK